MSKVHNKLRRQQGLTAVETLLALAAGALAVLGAVVLYNSAISADRVSKGSQQLVAVQQGVRSLYAGTASYTGLTVAQVVRADAVPSDMISNRSSGSEELRHPWKGGVLVEGGSATFTVTFCAVPEDACIKMLASQQGNLGSGLNRVNAGAGGCAAVTGLITGGLPVTVANATSACTGGAKNITWEFQ